MKEKLKNNMVAELEEALAKAKVWQGGAALLVAEFVPFTSPRTALSTL